MGLVKAQIQIEHSGEQISVLFNPEEYSLSKDNNFAAQNVPGLSSPILQFVHGNMRTLEMELFFDTSGHAEYGGANARDVRSETDRILGLLAIDSELHAPPILRVSWASLQFRCVLARVSQNFVKFLDDGRPIRARLSVTFNEFLDPEREARQVNRQTADFSKEHRVAQDEDISAIAWRHYEDPARWRPIAIENGIDDPGALVVGTVLRIPPLPYVDPVSGEVLVS